MLKMYRTTFFLLLFAVIFESFADDDRIYFPGDLAVSVKPLTKSSGSAFTEGKLKQLLSSTLMYSFSSY